MLKLIQATLSDSDEVQRIFNSTPLFNMNVEGVKIVPNAGINTLTELPPNGKIENKFVFFINNGNENIGLIDLFFGYPKENVVFIGLFMLCEKYQRKGLGLQSYQLILDFLHNKKIDFIQLAVVETNISAMAFWQKLGFGPNGRTGQYQGIKIQNRSIVLETIYRTTQLRRNEQN